MARLLGAPVVLVVDAARAGRSVAALAAGFAGFDPRTPVAGVILNQVASDRHERLLRDALAGTGLPVYGVIRRTEGIITPSRHLGLIPAAERAALAGQAIDRMGALIAASCDLDALLALAAGARRCPAPRGLRRPQPARTTPAPTIAIAGGAAFTFGYTEQAELLEAAGARVARFDPLRDEDLPEGTAGLVLGGGFPEMHAAGLSANGRLRDRVAALAARGAPVAAECAGLLYLARTLDDRPMCGVLDVRATMTPKLTLGYRQAVAVTDSVLARAGDVVRGHEFHRTAAVPAAGDQPAWQFGSRRRRGPRGRIGRGLLPAHPLGRPPGRGGQVHRRLRESALCMKRQSGVKRLIGVGVGPGDPELVTVKAVRVLREADVVLVPVLAASRTRRVRRTRPRRDHHPRLRRRGPDPPASSSR